VVRNCKFYQKLPDLTQRLKFSYNFLSFNFRFVVDLIDTFSDRWKTTSTESETRLKQSVIDFFASNAQPISKEMEEFEFELLKAELLTQPIEKEGSQLFHRKLNSSLGSSLVKKVSKVQ
jgi:hypothetical protein